MTKKRGKSEWPGSEWPGLKWDGLSKPVLPPGAGPGAVATKHYTRGLVSIDWDGVVHEDRNYRYPMGATDLDLIRDAQARGFAVAILTCNDPPYVAGYLRKHGFKALPDVQMVNSSWHGGKDGKVVLVSQRKLSSVAYIDDKAINHRYGQGTQHVWDELERWDGFAPCPVQHHWGPHGAAGVLPFAVFQGRTYVLLGQRNRGSQDGGTLSTFGGARHEGERYWDAAVREMREELSGLDKLELRADAYYRFTCPACKWQYVTFIVRIGDGDRLPFVRPQTGDWEVDWVQWIPVDAVEDYKLHPAFADAWPELQDRLFTALRASEVPA